MPSASVNYIDPAGAVLADAEFDFIRHVVAENAGIVLGPNKRQLVQGRLGRRLRELGLPSYEAYCSHLRDAGPEELVGLINAITTNVTSFFRENHHFEALEQYILPEALSRNAEERRLRIWSAGCSSGEEAYCIAMSMAQVMPAGQRWDAKVLATDIDSNVIAHAEAGVYPLDRLGSVSRERLQRWFRKGVGERAGQAMIKPELRSLIVFRTLNLLHAWPMRGPFDVIFCRNVMIYFDQPTRERLVLRFAQLLPRGGYLCIGHSESIHAPSAPFQLVGKTIYRRT
ncbi:MAG TPA: protein-glutamate O-methyltransferase CheR [Steroidobacter sp.]|jgi:chemotaxis protein methyltransferase CheR|nr:protein-glutamate O-methyltransferase CheR [Steroidobacteraceae bacterium]HLS81168.1 protein-glutamate O-methyltransferase CheR [Steroidobacter sp.]